MSEPLNLSGLLRQAVDTRTAIPMATGYGSRMQEYLTQYHWRFGLKRPAHMSAPFWSLFPYTDLRVRAGNELVQSIHRDAIKHGARIVTTGSWVEPAVLTRRNLQEHRKRQRRNPHSRKHRIPALGDNLSWQPVAKSVLERVWNNLDRAIRRAASKDTYVFPVGGFGPVSDSHSYNPKTVPSFTKILSIHRATVRAFPKTEMLLGETACNRREALAMAQAMREVCARTGQKWGISFTPYANGMLRDGTRLADVAAELLAMDGPKPSLLGVNCVPAHEAFVPVRELVAFRDAKHPDIAIAVYPNGPGHHEADPRNPKKLHWTFDNRAASREMFGRQIRQFASMGVNVIGGCCGTTCACGDLISDIVGSQNARRAAKQSQLVCL